MQVGPRHFDLDLQLRELQEAGGDIVVSSSAALGVDGLPLPEARALARFLNEARAQAEQDRLGRFYGLATLPLQDTDSALETLEEAVGTLGLRGVCIGSNVNGEPIDSERFWPIYELIERLNVPLFLHPTRSVIADRVTSAARRRITRRCPQDAKSCEHRANTGRSFRASCVRRNWLENS